MEKTQSTLLAVEQYILAAALILLSGLLIFSGLPDRLNNMLYDVSIRFSPLPPSEDSVIVAIDERSLDQLGQWPWRRQYHALLLEELTKAGAERVAFDIIFAEPDGDHPEDDLALSEAIEKHGNVFLPLHIHPRSNELTLSEVLPIPDLVAAAKGLGHIHVELDKDGIARGMFLKEGIGSPYWPSLSFALAQDKIDGFAPPVPVSNESVSAFVNIRTGYISIPFAGIAGSFPTVSYVDIINKRYDPKTFAGKTVFLGATAAGLGDVLPTPVSGLASPMPGVELHANAYSALVQHATIEPLSPLWVYLLTFAFVLIPVLILPRVPPEQTLLALVTMFFGVFLFTYGVLYLDRSWFPPASTLTGLVAAYPLWSWQRLSQLNRFLNQELERLHREPSLTQTDLAQKNLEKTLPELARLLSASGYSIKKNGETVRSMNAGSELVEASLQPWVWFHSGKSSWIYFNQDQNRYDFALFWSDVTNLDKKRAFLHRLHLADNAASDYLGSTYEKLALRISQVQKAIARMQDMRHFITDGLENMPDGVVVTDALGMVVMANTHASEWLGASKEKLENQSIARTLTAIYPHAENWDSILYKVLVDLQDVVVEVKRDQQDVLLHFTPSYTASTAGTGAIINFSEITLIRQQQREREELISFLSHDVRSPLVSQQALISRLQKEHPTIGASTFDSLRSYAQKSLDLAEQFLQINRAEHLSEQSFYECDLLSIVENSVDNIAPMARSKNVKINVHIEQDEMWTLGNADLLERAFTNILSNAVKYSPADTCVSIDASADQAMAKIRISDQGFGIDATELPHIFKRFHRQKKSESTGTPGSGLGLNFTYIVIQKHKGDIRVESEPDSGSIFTVTLPIAENS